MPSTSPPPTDERIPTTMEPGASLMGFSEGKDIVEADHRVLAVSPEFSADTFRRERLKELLFRERVYFWFCLAISTLSVAAFFFRLFSGSTVHGMDLATILGTGGVSVATYFAFRPYRQTQILTLMESIDNAALRDAAKVDYLKARTSRPSGDRKRTQPVPRPTVPTSV